MMIAYQTNQDGVYVGPVACDPSPLEQGVWLVPGGAFTIQPPDLGNNEQAVWSGAGWTVVDVTPAPQPDPTPQTVDEVQSLRHAAYIRQSDPVFFRWQRGEATEQDWLAAVAAVDAAHPYPAPL